MCFHSAFHLFASKVKTDFCLYRYAQYGEVSPKVDVYAFGVVLYELISAKAAVVKQNAAGPDSKGLVGMVSL